MNVIQRVLELVEQHVAVHVLIIVVAMVATDVQQLVMQHALVPVQLTVQEIADRDVNQHVLALALLAVWVVVLRRLVKKVFMMM